MQEAIKYFKMKVATHKKKVSRIILLVIKNLNKRRIYHDVSKTQLPELTLVSEAEYVADKDIKVNDIKRKKLPYFRSFKIRFQYKKTNRKRKEIVCFRYWFYQSHFYAIHQRYWQNTRKYGL